MFVWNEMSSMELASCEMLWALSLDLLDGAHGAGYRVAAFLDRAQYIGGVGIHGQDAFGVLSHHVRDALNVGGKLFDGGGLLGGALRDGLGAVRHLR